MIGDIGDGGGKLFHGSGLLGSALCQGLCAVGYLAGAGCHLIRTLVDLTQGDAQCGSFDYHHPPFYIPDQIHHQALTSTGDSGG